MNLWKRVIQRKLSLAYFLISLLFIVAGFWFAIPRLKGLGIIWTLISVVMGIYYGLDLFTKRGVFRAAETVDREAKCHSKLQTLSSIMDKITAWLHGLKDRLTSPKANSRENERGVRAQGQTNRDSHETVSQSPRNPYFQEDDDITARTNDQLQNAQDQAAPSREETSEGFIIPDSQTAIPMPPAGGFHDERMQGSFEIRLRSLEHLHRDGLISEEEYQEKRKQILEDKW
jgi:Short C-terminal domain